MSIASLLTTIPTSFAQVKNCDLNSAEEGCDTLLPMIQLNAETIGRVMQIFFGIIGVVVVIMIIVAGFHLVTSQGDSQTIAKARQTIIYAGVGLAIVVSAEAIITLVLARL
jgi:hypothetical protein